jgi:hypothetical protein
MMIWSKDGEVQFNVFDPGLYTTDAQGRTQINWAEWTRKYPRVVHVPVDSANLDGSGPPRCQVFFEPLLGERIVCNCGMVDREATRSALEQKWQADYGHSPRIQSTVSVSEAIEDLAGELLTSHSAQLRAPEKARFWEVLTQARQMAAGWMGDNPNAAPEMAELHRRLEFLLADAEFGPAVHHHLARTHPLCLQGGTTGRVAWLAIEDPSLQKPGSGNRWRLDRSLWKGGDIVYIDFKGLPRSAWAELPEAMVTLEGEFPYVMWNHQADLSDLQTTRLAQYPCMLHQYVQRIAGLWTNAFGRRPEVFVPISLVTLNHRVPQTIVDPRVDLAAIPLKWCGHNDWIVPLCNDPVELCIPARNVEKMRSAQRFPNGQPQRLVETEWHDGKPCAVTTLWYENGIPAARLECDERGMSRHVVQWHPNGAQAKELLYQDGKLAGRVMLWYPNGRLSWEGTFSDGQLQGRAVGWDGLGHLTEQSEFAHGVRIGAEDQVRQVHYEQEMP